MRRIIPVAGWLALAAMLSPACRESAPKQSADPAVLTDAGHARDIQAIRDAIRDLRNQSDDVRAVQTAELARRIRKIEDRFSRLALAKSLANLSTEGDFGRATLQEVTTTLAEAVRAGGDAAVVESSYISLAQLAKYEGMTVALDTPGYRAALAGLDELEQVRNRADFTLDDLAGRTWTRSSLKGQVVVVNFWATWCPPCRKEMPDLDSLYREYAPRGLVLLAISDESAETVRGYLADHPVSYPILLDPQRRVSDALKIDSLPKTFVYDRSGMLVAQSIDMRTRRQFLSMFAKAGLQ